MLNKNVRGRRQIVLKVKKLINAESDGLTMVGRMIIDSILGSVIS